MFIKKFLNEKLVVVNSKNYLLAFSYETLVAYKCIKSNTITITEKKHSRTTSKHIKYFINEYSNNDTKLESIPQQTLDLLFDYI